MFALCVYTINDGKINKNDRNIYESKHCTSINIQQILRFQVQQYLNSRDSVIFAANHYKSNRLSEAETN